MALIALVAAPHIFHGLILLYGRGIVAVILAIGLIGQDEPVPVRVAREMVNPSMSAAPVAASASKIVPVHLLELGERHSVVGPSLYCPCCTRLVDV